MKNFPIILTLTAIVLYFFTPTLTTATESDETEEEQGFSSSVILSYLRDDNILRDQNNIIDTNIFVVKPVLKWVADTGLNSFLFKVDGEFAKYEESSEDNYNDSGLFASGTLALDSRHQLFLMGSYKNKHNERGTDFSQGQGALLSEVDQYAQTDLAVTYTYGSDSSVGNLFLTVETQDVDYDARFDSNNVDVTSNRDRERVTSNLEFNYAISPRTDLVAILTNTEIEYDVDTGLNSSEDIFMVGISWEGAAKTTGRANFGYNDKVLDNGSSADGSTWQVGITWNPLTYSSFDLSSSKRNKESIGIANFRIVTNTGLSWSHQWKERLSTDVSINHINTDYDGLDISDNSFSFTVGADYQLKSWMALRLSYTNTERDTNSIELPFNYDQEVFSLSLLFKI